MYIWTWNVEAIKTDTHLLNSYLKKYKSLGSTKGFHKLSILKTSLLAKFLMFSHSFLLITLTILTHICYCPYQVAFSQNYAQILS